MTDPPLQASPPVEQENSAPAGNVFRKLRCSNVNSRQVDWAKLKYCVVVSEHLFE